MTVSDAVERVAAWIGDDRPVAVRIAFAVLSLFVVATAMLLLAVGPVPMLRYGHDVPVALDGAWRVYQGQRPHVDFYTTLGPLYFVVIAMGMYVVGPATQALVAATTMVLVVLTGWSWAIARTRMSPWLALGFSTTVGLTVVGAYLLGHSVETITYGAVYNRYCNAMLGIVLVESLLAPRNPSSARCFWGGASSGALAVLLFFTKFSFLAAASLLLAVSPLLVGWNARRIVGVVVGAAAVGLPMLVYLRGDVAAIVADIQTTSAVYGAAAVEPEAVSARLGSSSWKLACLPVLWCLYLALCGVREWIPIARLLAATTLVGAVTCLCLVTSYGGGDAPLPMFYGFVWLEMLRRRLPRIAADDVDGAGPLWYAAALAVVVYLVVPLAGKQCYSIAYAMSSKRTIAADASAVPQLRLDAEPLADLWIIEADGWNNEDYVGKVNQGLAMLRRGAGPEDRVFVADFSNPFNFALQRASPTGDSVSYHYDRNFNEAHHWPAEELLGDVTIILASRQYDPEATSPLVTIYADYINAHFEPRLTGDRWALFARKSSQPSPTPP